MMERGQAHFRQSSSYPKHWEGQVPTRVRMTKTVRPDFPFAFMFSPAERDLVCEEGKEYEVGCNGHGAVYAIFPGTTLGLKPDEFYVVAWEKPEGVKRDE